MYYCTATLYGQPYKTVMEIFDEGNIDEIDKFLVIHQNFRY